MPTEKLPQLRKELQNRSAAEVVGICLQLARLKTENKELLAYLLFDQENPLGYAQTMKRQIEAQLDNALGNSHTALKVFRKAFSQITKYSRFTKSKPGEVELLLYTLTRFTDKIGSETRFMPLLNVAFRALRKAYGLIGKLHEDLQYDYAREYNALLHRFQSHFRHWDHYRFSLPLFSQD